MRYVNDPRVIAQERGFVSINATIAVDLLGQCASETVARRATTRRAAARPTSPAARCTPRAGRASSCCTRRPSDGTISQDRRRSSPPGDVVTTLKNTVDKVVTEWGVAELRGRSIRERATGADRRSPIPSTATGSASEAAALGYC